MYGEYPKSKSKWRASIRLIDSIFQWIKWMVSQVSFARSYLSCFAHSLVSGLILDAYCVRYSQVMPFLNFFCNFTPEKLYIYMVFWGVSSFNSPKFTKICPFLFIPHVYPAFKQHAVNTFCFYFSFTKSGSFWLSCNHILLVWKYTRTTV